MITKFIEFAIRSRVLIFILTAVLFIIGAHSAFKVKRDILPDLAIPIITLVIENHTLGPEDMETLIARPLEAALRTAPGVNKVTSVCGPGLLALSVEFEWDSDTWRIRQSISEKIASVQAAFPQGTEVSSIGTASSRMTEIFEFYISGDTDEMVLREIADFMLKPKLQAARGVARVRTFGGDVRQYQILVDANKLKKFGISLEQLQKAIEENNHNFTGGIFATHGIEYIVRGIGAIKNSRELENVIITSSGGVPVYLSAVARIIEGPALKRGLMEVDGRRVVSLTISKQPEVDTILAVESVKTALAEITPFLPAGIKLESFFDQSDLINETSKNLAEAMLIGGAAVIIVLFLFMNNFLATFVTAVTIPLSVAAVFYLMNFFGLSANVMSLGGLVVGLGILIDASIVICENIFRYAETGKYDNYNCVVKGAAEVFKPVLTSTLIICVVFIPLITLSGFEGRVFYPFAFTIIASIFTGLILSFLLVPPLIFSLLSKRPEEKNINKNFTAETFLKFYKPLQRRVIAGGRGFSAAVFALFALSVIMLFNLPVELLPSIDENAIMISVVTPPGSSLAETGRLTKIACDRLKDAPDVEAVLQRSGRAEGSDCIEGVNVSEPYIKLVARNKRTHTIEQLFNIMNERVRDIPAILVIFTQPLANRIEETLSGTSAKFCVKLFGHDLRTLSEKGNELLGLISTVPGLTNLQLEQTQGVPTILIKPDRVKAAKYGLNIEDIARTVEMAIEGKTVSKVLNNGREYDIIVRLDERFRKKISDIGELYIDTPSFGKMKLGEISTITSIKGPGSIKRENMQRRIQINGSISGRDLFSIIEDIKNKLSGFNLADGYFISFGGNYEKQIKMLDEITYAFLLALIGVFAILYASFGSAPQSILIIATIPLALMGGVFALFITGMPLNISSLVGLIAHFGLSVQKGVILVEYINELRRRGHSMISSVIRAGIARLRPVMMTTLTTIFAVVPIAAGFGAGAEMQQPLAIVLIGGLITSTVFTLLLLPLFYGFTEKISASAFKSTRHI